MAHSAIQVVNLIIEISRSNGRKCEFTKALKLLYLCEAAYLVERNGKRLFNETIEAWKLGPVVPSVFVAFHDQTGTEQYDRVGLVPIPINDLEDSYGIRGDTKRLVERVVLKYVDYTARQLVELTHAPDGPWRRRYSPYKGDRVNKILPYDMLEYFRVYQV